MFKKKCYSKKEMNKFVTIRVGSEHLPRCSNIVNDRHVTYFVNY